MKHYDFILAGGGLAGLSIAFYLNQSSLRNKKILLIDKDDKTKNDRTWCFWTNHPTEFDDIVIKSWEQIQFFGKDFGKKINLSPFEYKMIRGIDFYDFVKQVLLQNPNIEWLNESVEKILEEENKVIIETENTSISGNWVFNSIFDVKDFQKKSNRYFYQLQHFKGWIIETDKAEFNPQEMHLMDFRTEQHNNARFFYVLPFNEHKALIEYTIFSDTLLEEEDYDNYLNDYIKQVLKINSFEIEETEAGVIPMTNHPFQQVGGKRIMNVGTIGGQVKASTGYAFYRVQEISKKIVQTLEHQGHPFYKKSIFDLRFMLYDTLLLQILQTKGGRIKTIFTALFKNNPIQNVFNFLNEKTTFWQEIRIFLSLPHLPFWQAIFSEGIVKPLQLITSRVKRLFG